MRSRWIRGPNQPAPIEDAEVGRFAYDLGFLQFLQFLQYPIGLSSSDLNFPFEVVITL